MQVLERNGRPSFNQVVEALGGGGLIAVDENSKYPGQLILVVKIIGFKNLCAVPCTVDNEDYFLHTVYESRKLTSKYGSPNDKKEKN